MLTDATGYRLMRLLQANPQLSQRAAAMELGISLGKLNYCVRTLSRRGLIRLRRVKNSRNKAAYVYLLTTRGSEEKARLAVQFLHARMREYEMLRAEIEEIRKECEAQAAVEIDT
jgi:EPS-associated MarR family transcriptional regulator